MKTIRKGNDIVVRWRIFRYGQKYDIALYRESISLVLSNMGEKKEITDYSIVDVNTIVFKYRAEDQGLGIYRLLLIDKSRNSTRIIEECNAFRLVNTSDAANNDDTLESAITITLTSELTAPADGLSAYEVALQNGFIGTEEEWLQSLLPDMTDIEQAEAQRQAKELERIASEAARESAESERQRASAVAVASANDAAASANAAASAANEAAVNANNKASLADEATNWAQMQGDAALDASLSAETQALAAKKAADNANAAAVNANTKAEEANNAAISANAAKETANAAAGSANDAAANAEQKATLATEAASSASTAAEAAGTAAGRANEAADKFSSAVVQQQGTATDKVMSQKTVTDALTASDQKLSELEGKLSKVRVIPNGIGYITTNVGIGNVVDVTNVNQNTLWAYYIIDVAENDKLVIKGEGGGSSRLWAFLDNESKLISISAASSRLDGYAIYAPQNAVRVVINNSLNVCPDGYVDLIKHNNFESATQALEQRTEGNVEIVQYKVGYINTNVGINNVVDVRPASINSDWHHYVIDVKEGDVLTLTARGGGNSRLWAFVDKEYKLISISASTLSAQNLKVVAPQNASFAIINTNVVYVPDSKVELMSGKSVFNILEQILPDTLKSLREIKVLVVGNSFSQKAVAMEGASLLKMCQAAGVKAHVEFVGNGGASFATSWNKYTNNLPCQYHEYGTQDTGWNRVSGDGFTIKEAFQKKSWDYIIFHQASVLSGDYSSFEPELSLLMKAARLNCSNEHMKIGFQQTWAYANNDGTYPNPDTGFNTQMEFYKAIVDAYSKASKDYDVDLVIPSGTAIQNARATSLGTTYNDFAASASDAIHINVYGSVLACMAWFASIWGKDLDIRLDDVPQFTDTYSSSEYAIAIDCVKKAILIPKEVVV